MFRLNHLILGLIALGLITASVFLSKDGAFDRLFGGRRLEAGDKFFEFDARNIESMEVEMRGKKARFERREDGVWWGKSPWIDRMDPRAAAAMLQFSLGTEIIDTLPRNKVNFQDLGLESDAVMLRLNKPDGHSAAKYFLGHRSPWIWKDQENNTEQQSLYAYTEYYDRSDSAYVITGNIRPLFDPEFRRLRDHRPFLFHSSQPEELLIQHKGSEIQLQRSSPTAPWRILKPIKLRTSAKRMQFLIEALEKLSATQVMNRNELTLPEGPRLKIAVKRFGEEHFTTLEVMEPTRSNPKQALATVSDRPNAIFALPLERIDNLIGLNELPLSVNDLRYRFLTPLDRINLRRIQIHSQAFPAGITIARESIENSPYLFKTGLEQNFTLVNEEQLKNLFFALAFSSVDEFVSDAALDLRPYQLHRPLIRIQLDYFNEIESKVLRISRGLDGVFYATIEGSKRVVSISPNLFSRIATEPFQWRPKRLFNFPSMDITEIKLTHHGEAAPLKLGHDYLNNEWSAQREDQNLSDRLNRNVAGTLLDAISTVRASTWLPADHPQAATALVEPTFSIEITYQLVDQFGDVSGQEKAGFTLARPSGAKKPALYYGRLEPGGDYFSLDMTSTRQFAQLYQALIED